MKKLSILILFLFVILPVHAQEGNKVYLPMIFKHPIEPIEHEIWKVVSPVDSSNYVLNPSAENTGNYSSLAAATITRSTTYQKYGLYSFRVQTGSNGQGVSLTLLPLTNTAHFVTFRVRGQLPLNLRMAIGTGLRTPLFIEHIDPYWDLYGAPFSAAEVNTQTLLNIFQQGNGIGDFYLDGIQVEPLPYWTTYCDGDQSGCYWDGSAHATKSIRSGKSLDGGQVIDLYEQYGFFVTRNIGAGMSSLQNNVDSYAILPGGELNSVKIQTRDFSLVGKFIAGSESELYANRKALHTLLKKDNRGQQLKWLIYHPNEIREIKAAYNGGLEGDAPVYYEEEWVAEGDNQWVQVSQFVEAAAINLKATDPYFYGIGDKVAVLDTNDSATFRTVAGRLKSTGQWSNLGPPNAAGTYNAVYAIVEDSTYVYIGGDFSNWDNIANADNIVRYNKSTGVYSALDVGLNNIVWSLALASNGDLYIGGEFTNAGGVAAADNLTLWDGTNFNAVGTPISGAAVITAVYVLKFNQTGILFIGGDFDNWANIAAADNIVSWDGSSYSALASGRNDTVFALTVALDNTLYVGGGFNGGGGGDYISSWNGTVFAAVGTTGGPSNTVSALIVNQNTGVLYAGSSATPFFQSFNGTSWTNITIDGFVNSFSFGADDTLFLTGNFSNPGGLVSTVSMARWNGYAFAYVDLDTGGINTVFFIMASQYADPVVKQKYDVFVGLNSSIACTYAGLVSVNNLGSGDAFPKIVFNRVGGTSATIETLRNEDSGKELLFNYSLLDGETLTVDLTPNNSSVVSSFFGPRPDAILANSDVGTWVLNPNTQKITSFIDTSGNPTITAWIQWRDTFESFD